MQTRLERVLLAFFRKKEATMKMPNLQGVGPALAKLQSEIEDDAKKFLDDVEATRTHKNTTFARGGEQLTGARAGLSEINKFIDELDRATNGGPTLGDSSQSPAVSAHPAETAHLAETR